MRLLVGTILNLDRETLLEIIMEHYGLEVEKYTITIFICLVPVVMDACVKLWVIFSSHLLAPLFLLLCSLSLSAF